MAKDQSSVGPMAEKTDEILVHLAYIRRGQDETNAHLKVLNGRMGSAETKIAVIESTIERRTGPRSARMTRGLGKGKLTAAAIAALFALVGALEAAKAVLAAIGQALQ